MIKRGQLISICALVTAFGLISTAPASAVELLPNWKNEKEILKAALPGTVQKIQFFIKDKSLGFTVLCEITSASSKVGPEFKSKLDIEFKNCSVVGDAECKLEEPININLEDQLVYKEPGVKGKTLYDVFYPEGGNFVGSTFAKITVLGCCPFAGKYEIKGSAIGEFIMPINGIFLKKSEIKFSGEASPTGEYENRATGKKEKAGELLDNGTKAFLEGEFLQEVGENVTVE